jgi:DNA-binding NtrC family response regulator
LQELRLHHDYGVASKNENGDRGNGNGHGHPTNGVPVHGADEKSSLKLLVRNAKGEAERGAIANALERTNWNRKAAARLLNVSYRALLYKIQEYHLSPPSESARLLGGDGMRQAK